MAVKGRIVTTVHRYKRPPKKRKAVAIEAAIVRKRATGPIEPGDQSNATEVPQQPGNDDRKPEPLSTGGQKSAIVTTTSRKRARQRASSQIGKIAEPDDPEADAAMRAWIERAKWGHRPAR